MAKNNNFCWVTQIILCDAINYLARRNKRLSLEGIHTLRWSKPRSFIAHDRGGSNQAALAGRPHGACGWRTATCASHPGYRPVWKTATISPSFGVKGELRCGNRLQGKRRPSWARGSQARG